MLALLLLLVLSVATAYEQTLTLYTTEAFFVSMADAVFNSSDLASDPYEFPNHKLIRYRPSLQHMPDLPDWMRYMYSDNYQDGFIYGVPHHPGTVTVEVVATDLDSYHTHYQTIKFHIKPRKDVSRYQVQLKFTNLNVEDMFLGDRKERLKEILYRRLWKDNRKTYMTMVESAVEMGGRKPINPHEKDGVVVRIGSMLNFSRELESLEREVMILRNREPCPKDYKKTSAERFFRDEDFIPDWCAFRLLSDKHRMSESQLSGPKSAPIHLMGSADYEPPVRDPQPRDLTVHFLLCIITPTVIACGLAALLSCIMFANREGVEKRNRDTPSVQMVQYATIHRASDNLRNMTANRDGSTAATPVSTLPRSYASQHGTLTKASVASG